MWGVVLLMAVGAALDPVRLGIALLMISRPRPVLNLLVYWLGGMATGVALAPVVLLLLRYAAPRVTIVMQDVGSTALSAFQQAQVPIAVLALLIAALLAARFPSRQEARVPTPGGDSSALALQPNTSGLLSRLSTRLEGAVGGGNLWVAFVAGLGSAVPPIEYNLVLVAILGSGAAFGTQVCAAVAFAIVAFALVEIPLITYLVAPAKTQSVMLQLHSWVRANRPRTLALILAVGGVVTLATKVGVG
jgi:hypothetical protein